MGVPGPSGNRGKDLRGQTKRSGREEKAVVRRSSVSAEE